jgi:membrane-associated protease RseP (regulator of RpoE activity)
MQKHRFAVAAAALMLVVAALALATVVAPRVSAAPAADRSAATTPVPATDQAWLGVTVVTLNAQVAKQYNLDQTEGVAVIDVTADSPAAAAGVQKGDLVKAVNGVAVKTSQEVVAEVRKAKPGDTVTLTLTRAGKDVSVQVKAESMPTRSQGRLPGRTPSDNAKPTPQPGDGTKRMPTLPTELQGLLNLSFDSIYGSTQTFKDANGNVVTVKWIPGVVTAISANSITIKPNNPQTSGGPYTIDDTTLMRAGRGAAASDAINVDDKVTVVVVGDSTHASIVTSAATLGGGKIAPFGGGFHFKTPFGRGDFQMPGNMFDRFQKPTTPSTSDKGA